MPDAQGDVEEIVQFAQAVLGVELLPWQVEFMAKFLERDETGFFTHRPLYIKHQGTWVPTAIAPVVLTQFGTVVRKPGPLE